MENTNEIIINAKVRKPLTEAQKEVKNVSYVVRRYSEIPDNQIKVSEEEVKAFYDEHKNEKKYESTAGRDVKFFDLPILLPFSSCLPGCDQLDNCTGQYQLHKVIPWS
jgi:hypothetical protein